MLLLQDTQIGVGSLSCVMLLWEIGFVLGTPLVDGISLPVIDLFSDNTSHTFWAV